MPSALPRRYSKEAAEHRNEATLLWVRAYAAASRGSFCVISQSPIRPGSGYGVDRLADDIAAVIERLKLEHPVLMGHSFAGDEVSNVISSSETSQASGVACNQGFFLRPRPSLKLALALPGGLGIRRLFHIDERQRRS